MNLRNRIARLEASRLGEVQLKKPGIAKYELGGERAELPRELQQHIATAIIREELCFIEFRQRANVEFPDIPAGEQLPETFRRKVTFALLRVHLRELGSLNYPDPLDHLEEHFRQSHRIGQLPDLVAAIREYAATYNALPSAAEAYMLSDMRIRGYTGEFPQLSAGLIAVTGAYLDEHGDFPTLEEIEGALGKIDDDRRRAADELVAAWAADNGGGAGEADVGEGNPYPYAE